MRKGGEQALKDAAANPNDPFFQKRIEDAPRQEHDLYYEAFWELGSERQIGMAEGQIPLNAIKAYAADPDLELTRRERWAFHAIIRKLDSAYLSLEADRRNAATKGARKGR